MLRVDRWFAQATTLSAIFSLVKITSMPSKSTSLCFLSAIFSFVKMQQVGSTD